MHSYHAKPKINVGRLVIEAWWYWSTLAVCRSPRIDDERLRDVEGWPIFFAVIREQVIALSCQIDQLLELVWDGEVPHRQAQDNSVRSLEATDQFLNPRPCMRFCVCHWLVLNGLVLRSGGCGVKLREFFVPDIQDVLINRGDDFPGSERKALVRAIEFDLSPRGDD